MRTIYDIKLWQGMQLLQMELDTLEPLKKGEKLRKGDCRLWSCQEYFFIKSRVMDLFNNPSFCLSNTETIKTPKRKYLIDYSTDRLPSNEKELIISHCEDYRLFIRSIHFIIAMIAQPVPSLFRKRELSFHERANDLLNAKYIDAFAVVTMFSRFLEERGIKAHINRVRHLWDGGPPPVKLIETPHGIIVTT